MITVPRNPYHVRQSRSSSPDSYSSISQMGDYGDMDSFKTTPNSISSKLYSHHDQVCFNSLINSTNVASNIPPTINANNANNNNNINTTTTTINNNILNNNNININSNHLQRNNHQIHVINPNHDEPNNNHNTRTPLTISRSYSSNSSLASNDSFNKDKRRPPLPPKGHIMYHPSRYKTELCRQWEELGYCEYDDRCLFAHGVYELKPLPNRHPKYKTEKCSAFHDQGFCSFGPRCSFIHSKVDPADLLEKVLTNLPKIPMPENPEDKENYNIMIADCEDDDRLPIFKKIAPISASSTSTSSVANTSTGSMSSNAS